ncbi:hypothetical protein Pst134EA_013555 [Puccinia striiformis f. sp. tritici]|uniref:hypothetical protein n=1 Tax=Puccinia striiformis f. sp. tritici TaxID=168172 RepID=UPI002007266F|nr:hypothetical protein Pst134EA_013555 [Puccinia striiformis f. sp. tritici]KAH9465675.1 hypothetical protein Pst134EA_013555 [Puccinia striiformis f. sp. tritici]
MIFQFLTQEAYGLLENADLWLWDTSELTVYTYQLASHQDGFVINISGTGNYCQTCKNFVVAEGCKLPNEAGKGVEITCDQMWGKSGVQNVCRSRTSDAAYTCEKKKDGQPTPVCYGCDHK